MKGIFIKIFKTFIASLSISFFATIILMIGNKIMGVDCVGLVYILLGTLCFLMLFAGLLLVRADYIFKRTKSKKVNKKQAQRTKQQTKTHPKNIQRKSSKREIS